MITIGIECESIETDSWGIARTVNELLRELANRPELKNKFRFILYFKKVIPDLPYGSLEIMTPRVAGLSSFSMYYYLWLPWATRRDKLDLMFFPNYMLPYGMRCKTLVTLTEDGYEAMHSKWLPWRFRLAYRIFMTHAARAATMINTYSHTSAREVSRRFGIDPSRIFVNHLGVQAVEPLTPNLAVQPLSYVLYVGQMFPRRHAKETILACRKLGVRLVMVGIDKYSPPLMGKRGSGGDIEQYDHVSDEKLEELYQGARLFVYVSDTEAFGLPPLEALARGVRPVVADTDVAHELFGSDAIYATTTVDGIADAIQRGLALPKPQPVIKFTWKEHADRFLHLCRLISTSTPSQFPSH